MQANRRQLITIFLIIFIDLLGFGLIIPIIPFYIQNYLLDPHRVGRTIALMIALFSMMQFIFSPVWGRLSDRYGRRPILLFSLGVTACGHLLFALAGRLELLFAARILTGIFSATVPTAMAYISDVTSAEERAKGMGMVGAAFGLGFILGPAAGGVLSGWGGVQVPLLGAGVFSLAALIFAYFNLTETVDTANPVKESRRRFNIANLIRALRHPNIGILYIIFFIVSLSFSGFETVFALYLQQAFNYGSKETGYFFALIGGTHVLTQGLLIGRLSQRFGEKRLITASTLTLSVAFILMTLPKSILIFAALLIATALSLGLHNPSVNSLISKNAARDEQGGLLGISQSFSALGRVIGPTWAGLIFDKWGPTSSFISSGALIFGAAMLSLRLYRKKLAETQTADQ